MGVHSIVHRQPRVLLKAQVAHLPRLSLASVTHWRFEKSRLTFRRMAAATSNPPWTTEELAKARRRRHLLDDNPASG